MPLYILFFDLWDNYLAAEPASKSTQSVTVSGSEACVCLYWRWFCSLSPAISLLFPLVPCPSFTHFNTGLRGKLPGASVCECDFQVSSDNFASLQISFTNVLESKHCPASRSGEGGELAIQDVFWDQAILHVGDITKPAWESLGEEGKHAWSSC